MIAECVAGVAVMVVVDDVGGMAVDVAVVVVVISGGVNKVPGNGFGAVGDGDFLKY